MDQVHRALNRGIFKLGAVITIAALLLLVFGLAVTTHPFWQDREQNPTAILEIVTDRPTGELARDGQTAPYCERADTIEQYTCLIEQSAFGASKFLRADYEDSPENVAAIQDAFTVLSTLDLVSTIVSSSRYYFLKKNTGEHFEVPGSNAELCLDRGYGICGNHYAVFEEFLKRLDIPVRYVRMYFINKDTGNKNSHIAAEVKIDGSWRYVDVSKGAIWLGDQDDLLSMMSFNDVMQGRGHLIHNAILPWTLSKQLSEIDNFPYLKSEHLDHVIGDMHGILRVYFEDSDGRLNVEPSIPEPYYRTNLRGIPSYVSMHRKEAGSLARGIGYRLMLPETRYMATFSIEAISVCDDSRLSIGGREFDLGRAEAKLSVEVDGGDIVKIVGDSEHCRVSFASIEASRIAAKPT